MDLALMRVEEDLGHTVALPRSYRVVFLKRPGGIWRDDISLPVLAAGPGRASAVSFGTIWRQPGQRLRKKTMRRSFKRLLTVADWHIRDLPFDRNEVRSWRNRRRR